MRFLCELWVRTPHCCDTASFDSSQSSRIVTLPSASQHQFAPRQNPTLATSCNSKLQSPDWAGEVMSTKQCRIYSQCTELAGDPNLGRGWPQTQRQLRVLGLQDAGLSFVIVLYLPFSKHLKTFNISKPLTCSPKPQYVNPCIENPYTFNNAG